MSTQVHKLDLNAFVDALYRVLLSREPDRDGRDDKIARLTNGLVTIEGVIAEIAGSTEFADVLPETLARLGVADRVRFTNDASQYGEFLELLRLWVSEIQVGGVVVDVGARGRARSNSYDLMKQFGWRGVLIEANPGLLEEIKRDFAGLDFSLINCAVSDFDGRATFTLGVNEDVSSLNPDMAKAWGESPGVLEVQARRLEPILQEQQVPASFDLLSLDIEGEDIKVLNDLIGGGWYKPRWIIIEASHDFSVMSLDQAPFSDLVKESYVLKAQTRANLILRRRADDPQLADGSS